jgi:hypothetical protein
MSDKITDLRLALEKLYRTEGIRPIGRSTIEGVLKDKDTSSTVDVINYSQISRGATYLEDL